MGRETGREGKDMLGTLQTSELGPCQWVASAVQKVEGASWALSCQLCAGCRDARTTGSPLARAAYG